MKSYPFKKRILIVDDEPSFTEMVKLNLEATGNFLVKTENRGRQALDTALVFRPDLILLDIVMPDVDGADVCIQLKNHADLANVPIVFLTATVRKGEVDPNLGGDIGGHAFLAKPAPLEELITSIEDHLEPPSQDLPA